MEVKVVEDVSDAEDYSLHIPCLIIQTRLTERELVLTEITAKPRPAPTLSQERLERIWLLLMKSIFRGLNGYQSTCGMIKRHDIHEQPEK